MAIAFRGSSVNVATGATSIAPDKPVSVVDGDVMVLVVSIAGGTNETVTTPAGWALLEAEVNNGTDLKQVMYWRVASGEPASYTVSYTPAANAVSNLIALSGADTNQPSAAQVGQATNAASDNVTIPAISGWAASNGIDLGFATIAFNNFSNGPSAGYTDAGTQKRQFVSTQAEYKAFTNVTSTGSLTVTWTGAGSTGIGGHVFIKEFVAAGPMPPARGTYSTTDLESATGAIFARFAPWKWLVPVNSLDPGWIHQVPAWLLQSPDSELTTNMTQFPSVYHDRVRKEDIGRHIALRAPPEVANLLLPGLFPLGLAPVGAQVYDLPPRGPKPLPVEDLSWGTNGSNANNNLPPPPQPIPDGKQFYPDSFLSHVAQRNYATWQAATATQSTGQPNLIQGWLILVQDSVASIPQMGHEWRRKQYLPAVAAQDEVWQDFLLLTTTPPVPPPFAQYDWPNPIWPRPMPLANRTWLQSGFVPALSPTEVPPNGAQIYALPPAGYPFPLDLRSWMQSPAVPEPIPFAQLDWPNPILPLSRIVSTSSLDAGWIEQVPNYLLTEPPVPESTNSMYLYPDFVAHPARDAQNQAAGLAQDEVWQDFLNPLSPTEDIPIGVQEFSSALPPKGYVPGVDLRNWLQSAWLLAVAPTESPAPGVQIYELPPRGYPPLPVEDLTWIQSAWLLANVPTEPIPDGKQRDELSPKGYPPLSMEDLTALAPTTNWLVNLVPFEIIPPGIQEFTSALPPKGYSYPTELRTWINLGEPFLTGHDLVPKSARETLPYGHFDRYRAMWAAAAIRAGDPDQVRPTTLLPIALPVGQSSFPDSQQLLPVRARTEDLTWIQSSVEAVELLIQSFYQNEWTNPVRPTPPRVENLTWLQSTSQSARDPFPSGDFPNPTRVPRQPVDNLTWINSITFTEEEPIGKAAFPEPTNVPRPQTTNLTWISLVNRQEDVPVGVSAQPQDYTAPARVVQQPETLRSQPLVLTPAEPFTNYYDWPLPIRLSTRVDNLTWLSFGLTEFVPIGQSIQDFHPTLRDVPQSVIERNNLPLETPFVQADWPVPPQAAPRNVENLTFVGSVLLTAHPPIGVQAFDYLPPVPTVQQPQAQGVSLETLAAPAPFASGDWPLPLRATAPKQALGPQNLSLLPIETVFTPAPSQLDWPNPVRAQEFRPELLEQQGTTQLIYAAPLGIQLTPDPMRMSPRLLQDQVSPATPLPLAATPFAQLDWPNPTLGTAYFRQEQISPFLTLIDNGVQPFAQYDWPRPTLPRWTDRWQLPSENIAVNSAPLHITQIRGSLKITAPLAGSLARTAVVQGSFSPTIRFTGKDSS